MAVGVGGQTRQSSNDPIRGLGLGARPEVGATTLYAAWRWELGGRRGSRATTLYAAWVWEPDLGWAQRPYTRYGGGGWGADAAVEQRPYTRLGFGSQTWGGRNDPIRGMAA